MTTPTNPTNRKFTALLLDANRETIVTLRHGKVVEHYDYSKKEFDTEEEAITYAFSQSPYGTWMIAPIISFDMWPGD